mgnify:CR=1 FL=1
MPVADVDGPVEVGNVVSLTKDGKLRRGEGTTITKNIQKWEKELMTHVASTNIGANIVASAYDGYMMVTYVNDDGKVTYNERFDLPLAGKQLRRPDDIATLDSNTVVIVGNTEIVPITVEWDGKKAKVTPGQSQRFTEPESFQLDDQCVPTEVSGVPPDYFSADGQLWGNPLYAWDRMQADGFGWWIRRVDGASKLYDVIRIDHFRGFEAYWAVPYGETTAKNGHWVKGPGMNLVGVLTGWFPQLRFIAEDLGYPTPGVQQLLQDSGLPGMKVLEFAFDSRDTSSYLPHSYTENCVCYTGTHDNSPLALWKDEAAPEDIDCAREYLGLNDREGFNWGIIRGGMSSVARLFVAQMQDYLELGLHHRTNVPGTQSGNWQWRLLPGEATPALARRIRHMTEMYGR